MIKTKDDYIKYCYADNVEYFNKSFSEKIVCRLARYPDYEIMQFKKYLRKAELAFNTMGKSRLKWIRALYYERKKNFYGERLGIEIDINCFGKGLKIYHGAGIVVNPSARIGENCKLHGNNCIGNNGKTEGVPVLGNNVDIGFGACVIGEIELADNIMIGANAVVVKSCKNSESVLAGIPAKEIER